MPVQTPAMDVTATPPTPASGRPGPLTDSGSVTLPLSRAFTALECTGTMQQCVRSVGQSGHLMASRRPAGTVRPGCEGRAAP
jgi:hypothetical protein